MRNYIRTQTAGQIIRNSYVIYWQHFRTLSIIFFLPTFPLAALTAYAQFHTGFELLYLVAVLLLESVGIFASAAIAIAISDISLGNRPGVLRSWRRVLGPLTAKLFYTYILVLLLLIAGLGVFSLFFYTWFMFSLTVVALERKSGTDALRRSKGLGKGMYVRNLGVSLLLSVVTYIYYILVILIVAAILHFVIWAIVPNENVVEVFEMEWVKVANSIIVATIVSIFVAPIAIGTVLLYFDMRSRKEAYDTTVLAEELRR